MANLRDTLLQHFRSVNDVPYVGGRPDDWRKPRPASFNCSSFVQWIALRALGWTRADAAKYDPPNAGALLAEFPRVPEDDISVGDALIYVGVGARGPSADHAPAMHTMLYIGDEEVIGACDEAGGITRRCAEYSDGWRLIGAVRISRIAIG